MDGSVEEFVNELEEKSQDILSKLAKFLNKIATAPNSIPPELRNFANQDTENVPAITWADVNSDAKDLQLEILQDYEEWYVASEDLVVEYLPNRIEDFRSVRERIIATISLDHDPTEMGKQETYDKVAELLGRQKRIVTAIPAKIRAQKHRARRNISKQVTKHEVGQARELLSEGFTRASGVVAGVALERHLLTLCEEARADVDYEQANGLTQLAQALYEAGELDKTTFKSIDTLASIRNDCAHAGEQEPNEHKVRRLIEDTEDYIRGRGL